MRTTVESLESEVAVPEAERSAFVVRRLVTELCRFLNGDPLQDESPAAPTKVFISHTKLDLGQEPKVVEALRGTGHVVVANDVTLNDAFLPNAMLPDTQSEIALPMLVESAGS